VPSCRERLSPNSRGYGISSDPLSPLVAGLDAVHCCRAGRTEAEGEGQDGVTMVEDGSDPIEPLKTRNLFLKHWTFWECCLPEPYDLRRKGCRSTGLFKGRRMGLVAIFDRARVVMKTRIAENGFSCAA
jgi:hypothetical protein